MNDESWMRDSLRRAVQSIRPADDALDSLRIRIESGRQRQTARRALTILLSLGLSFAAGYLVWVAFTSDGDRLAGPGPNVSRAGTPPTPQITASIELGGEPQSITAGEGAAWVARVEPGCISVIERIDDSSTEATRWATVDMAVTRLQAAADAVWATGARCRADGGYEGAIARIDPDERQSARIATVIVGAGTSDLVRVGESAWASVDQARGGAGIVLRIDPDTLESEVTLELAGIAAGLQYGAGSLWVGETVVHPDALPTSRILRVNPTTSDIEASIPVDSMGSFAVSDQLVWVQQHGDTAIAYDTATNTSAGGPVQVSRGGGFDPFATDDQGVWYLGERQDGQATIGHLNAASRQTDAQLTIGGDPVSVAMSPSGETVWVADASGLILRVDVA